MWCGNTYSPEWVRHEIIWLYSISGHLEYNNGRDIVDATVSVGGNNVQTNGSGNYTLNNVPTGPGWWVTPPSGYSWIPSRYDFTVDGDVTGKKFTASRHSISGTVKNYLNLGVSGVRVTASSQDSSHTKSAPLTGSSGIYTITGLYSETYEVTATKSGHNFPPQDNITISTTNRTVNFRSYAIYGYVKDGGINDPGIDNATINISGAWNGTVSTGVNNNGYYIKSGLANGNYTVEAQATGYIFEPLSQSANIDGVNAANKNFYSYTIKGRVLRYGTTTGVPGVNINIKQGTSTIATDITEQDGTYEVKNLGGGTYTIEATNP